MGVQTDLPIFLISCRRDKDRRAAALASCASYGAAVEVIDAIDARNGLEVFRPFLHLVGQDFWMGTDIKPGALGCFLSHRLAWAALANSGAAYGLVMEDDSRLTRKPGKVSDVDILWVNNRMDEWASVADETGLGDLISAIYETDGIDRSKLPKAPGADGYILSAQAAERLLVQSETDKIRCGVDWYMMALVLGDHLRQANWSAGSEPDKLAQIFPDSRPEFRGGFSRAPMIKNDRHWGSSIGHSKRIELSELQRSL